METLYLILFNIFVVLSVGFVTVLAYSIRSNGAEFDLFCWFVSNKTRFISGGLLGVLIAVLTVLSPDVDALLKIIGFDASKTPVSIGLALGALLVAGVSGNKLKEK